MAEGIRELEGVDKQLVALRGHVRFKTIACGAGALLLAFCCAVLFPRGVSSRVLDIHLSLGNHNGQGLPTVLVLVSNTSPNTVIYDNGPVLEIACLRNGIWKTNVSGRSVTGHELLPAGTARKPIDITEYVEPSTTAVRVGLACTSFSWRSSLAWHIPQNRFLNPVASSLFALDKTRRSRTEWSEVLDLKLADTEKP